MVITFQSEGIDLPKIKKRKTSDWIKSVAQKYGKKIGNISYLFCTDEKILEINRQYLQHDFYTDIITFDDTEGEKISGDIVISIETVRSNSQKYQTSFPEELHRVIIHGVLHLCGLNDEEEKEKRTMREAEDAALAQLNGEY